MTEADIPLRPQLAIENMWAELRKLEGPLPNSLGPWEKQTRENVSMLALVSIADSLHWLCENNFPVLRGLPDEARGD